MCSSNCKSCNCKDKSRDNYKNSADVQVLIHHIYEYKKGIRNLVLHTMNRLSLNYAEAQLERHNISFCTQVVSENKVNIFFGKEECVEIVKTFADISLSKITNEQDFMLGVMLGYDRMQQCSRYMEKHYRGEETKKISNRFSIVQNSAM